MPRSVAKIDKAAITVAHADPTLSNYQIGKRLEEMGVMPRRSEIYTRLRKSTYLRGELAQIRAHHRERLSRTIVPLALDTQEKVLKNKDLSPQAKFPYVKLALDKEFGEGAPAPASTIHIGTIQAIIQGNLLGSGDKAD